MYYHWKIELIGQPLGKKNVTTCTFWKKCPKTKRHYFPPNTTFYKFALKTKTSWAENVVKPVLETWNAAMLLCMFGLFILWPKCFKNMQCKKE